jgi:hypothetical protein
MLIPWDEATATGTLRSASGFTNAVRAQRFANFGRLGSAEDARRCRAHEKVRSLEGQRTFASKKEPNVATDHIPISWS